MTSLSLPTNHKHYPTNPRQIFEKWSSWICDRTLYASMILSLKFASISNFKWPRFMYLYLTSQRVSEKIVFGIGLKITNSTCIKIFCGGLSYFNYFWVTNIHHRLPSLQYGGSNRLLFCFKRLPNWNYYQNMAKQFWTNNYWRLDEINIVIFKVFWIYIRIIHRIELT